MAVLMDSVKQAEKVVEGSRRYEIGFLLSPLLTEESLDDTVKAVVIKAITAKEGVVEDLSTPKRLALAYPVAKVINHKRSNFKEAYLGAVVFTAPTEVVAKILQEITAAEVVIRTLLVEKPFRPVAEMAPRETRKDHSAVADQQNEVVNADTVAIDKEIEELLV